MRVARKWFCGCVIALIFQPADKRIPVVFFLDGRIISVEVGSLNPHGGKPVRGKGRFPHLAWTTEKNHFPRGYFGSKIYFPPSLSISTILHVYVKKSELIYGKKSHSKMLEGLAPKVPQLRLELQTVFFTPSTQRLLYCLGLVFVPCLKHAFSFEEILEAAVCATVTEEGGHCVA
jgi:hypothetical protein